MSDNDRKTNAESKETGTEKPVCGIVRPISEQAGLSAAHWEEVHMILSEAVEAANFSPKLVSEAEFSGVLQSEIIHNLYSNPMCICVVSGLNPNVMFELGLRLAFDKPTIIVKDDKTAYNFDTKPILHVPYQHDLSTFPTREFQQKLTALIVGTHKQAKTDPEYSTFLKYFGKFTVPELNTTEVTHQELILQRLDELGRSVSAVYGMLGELETKPYGLSPDNSIGAFLNKFRGPATVAELAQAQSVGSLAAAVAAANPAVRLTAQDPLDLDARRDTK